MYNSKEIKQFIDLVAEVADPDKIILFGSYAYGVPDDKSDLDLLVIKNGKEFSREEHADLSTAVYLKRAQYNISTRYDVFFRTEKQVQESAESGGAFLDALQKGQVVYERTNQQKSRIAI